MYVLFRSNLCIVLRITNTFQLQQYYVFLLIFGNDSHYKRCIRFETGGHVLQDKRADELFDYILELLYYLKRTNR